MRFHDIEKSEMSHFRKDLDFSCWLTYHHIKYTGGNWDSTTISKQLILNKWKTRSPLPSEKFMIVVSREPPVEVHLSLMIIYNYMKFIFIINSERHWCFCCSLSSGECHCHINWYSCERCTRFLKITENKKY